MSSNITSPDVEGIISPLLSALPAAAMSPEPAPATLQQLTPILRQRVQLLKQPNEPWLGLLQGSSVTDKNRLSEIARSNLLEPHPVSGEIELDWDRDVQTRFRRLDEETLHCLVVLKELNLFFRLVYCAGGHDGPGEGWKVGEVGVAKKADGNVCELDSFRGYHSVAIAEQEFIDEEKKVVTVEDKGKAPATGALYEARTVEDSSQTAGDDDDDDGSYWDQYGGETPARTPGAKSSPAPLSMRQGVAGPSRYAAGAGGDSAAEAAYFSQYDSVQPALDNHDPDEEASAAQFASPPPPLGMTSPPMANANPSVTAPTAANDAQSSSLGSSLGSPDASHGRHPSMSTHSSPPSYAASNNATKASENSSTQGQSTTRSIAAVLQQPRAQSPSSSQSSDVARLEEAAQNFGVSQHISRTIKSLYQLSRSSGMDREDFGALVKRELEMLGMIPEDDY